MNDVIHADQEIDQPGYPLVSIIIPCYNRSKIVERAIRSVLSQTSEDWELVIVDDASTDGDELKAVVEGFDNSTTGVFISQNALLNAISLYYHSAS